MIILKTLKEIVMRKINFLWLIGLLLLMPFGFPSCSNGDDEDGAVVFIFELMQQSGSDVSI